MTHLHFTLETKEIQSLIDKTVEDDLSKTILTTIFNQLMEEQRTQYFQAGEYERTSQRNDYYEIEWTTRIGTLNLSVLRTRDGNFPPNVFDRYQRNKKALLTSMLEMYVSTQKVSQVDEELCDKKVSKSFISDLTQQLDPMVKEWQYRFLLETTLPFIMVDVLYIKVPEEHRVLSKIHHIALGITAEGEREIIGLMIQNGESDESWSIFFDYLKQRGFNGTELVISNFSAFISDSFAC